MKVTVHFMMWGQECQTEFEEGIGHHPLDWIRTMYEKGWLDPIEVVRDDDVVTVTKEKMVELKRKWL